MRIHPRSRHRVQAYTGTVSAFIAASNLATVSGVVMRRPVKSRRFATVSRNFAFAALSDLYRQEVVDRKTIDRALDELEIDPERPLRELS